MEHMINLASKAFIEAICPTPSHYTKGKCKTTAHNHLDSDREASDDDTDELAWLENLAKGHLDNVDTEVDKDMEFDTGNLLGKVLSLINQVCTLFISNLISSLIFMFIYVHLQKQKYISQPCARKKDYCHWD